MRGNNSTWSTGRTDTAELLPTAWLEANVSTSFLLAGGLLLGSATVPPLLKLFTKWAWVAGLLLAGTAVLAVTAGLLGLYPRLKSQHAGLAALSLVGASGAAVGAVALVSLASVALVGTVGFGMQLGKPVGLFMLITGSMTGGLALGFLTAGLTGWRSNVLSRLTSLLFMISGGALLVPVGRVVLHRGLGLSSGIPRWTFLPVLGLLVLVLLALGYSFTRQS